jgi:peptidoglycan/LPS O-acetylase OafA/YrhL
MLIIFYQGIPLSNIVVALTYTTNWIMAFGILPIRYWITHLWSLAVEEQYYLIWPTTLLFILHRHPSKWFLIIFPFCLALASAINRVILFQLSGWNRVQYGFDTHADGLLLGSALGLAFALGKLPKGSNTHRFLQIAFLPMSAFFIWLVISPEQSSSFYVFGGYTFFSIAIALIIWWLIVFQPPIIHRIVQSHPLILIGRISYALYLWHAPIWHMTRNLSINIPPALLIVGNIVISFLFALFSQRYIERPLLRLKNRFQPT